MAHARRIIIIEDDPDLAWLVEIQLRNAGYDTGLAADGAAGLERFLDGGADLLLLDVNLPVMDGLQVLGRVREVSDVPVVLMTAYAWDRDDLRALGLRMEHYMPKPFSVRDLMARVESLLGDETVHTELLRKPTGDTT